MIDVTHQVNEVQRRVGTRTLEAGEARVLTISQTYRGSLEELWDACTNPERLPRWFLPVSGELRVGGRYQIEGNASGTILGCEPPNRLEATWEYGDEVSWIEVRLSAEPEGRTRLQLEHVAHVDDERWAEFGPGAVGIGWDLALMGLADHLAGADPVDPQRSAEWAASDAGKQFMARSSELWCEASIAAGTDKAAAAAAAERTTAFYTGDYQPGES